MITDRSCAAGRPVEDLVEQAVDGGADAVQLRDKSASDEELVRLARRVMDVTRRRGVPLIVNDRPAVARSAGADGVHLGQDDGPLAPARRLLGEEAIIGRSTHSPEQAMEAEREGFDYIGVGPVYGTPTKPDYVPVGLELVRFASSRIAIPFVAIGGIDAVNASEVARSGARAVAVVRAVMGSGDPAAAARAIREAVVNRGGLE